MRLLFIKVSAEAGLPYCYLNYINIFCTNWQGRKACLKFTNYLRYTNAYTKICL